MCQAFQSQILSNKYFDITMLNRVVQLGSGSVQVSQDLGFGHAGTVWDGALTLIAYLNKNYGKMKHSFQGKVILQLGAGTGIVGLATIHFNPQLLILTDFPQNLAILQHNSKLNFGETQKIISTDLSWGDETSLARLAQHKVDVIIGSELAYDATNIRLLIKTIDYFKALNSNLLVIIGYTRYPQKERTLLSYLTAYNFEDVAAKDMDQDYRDDILGIVLIK